MKKLLPILLLLLGAGGGVGAGLFLRPPPPEPAMMADCAEGDEHCEVVERDDHGDEMAAEDDGHSEAASMTDDDSHAEDTAEGTGNEPEYVALQRQMIVPIVSDDKVISLVVLSLSIEVKGGFGIAVYDREPKLRDAFLQVLFRHANTGGFNGDFTSGEKMADLRRALNSAAAQVLGPVAIQVLVTDILRQAT